MIAANEAVAEELDERTRSRPSTGSTMRRTRPPRRPEGDLASGRRRPCGASSRTCTRAPSRTCSAGRRGRRRSRSSRPLVLRTMQRALYAPECRGHYALASRYYTHFTSPIRRYPDLVVHRPSSPSRAGPNGWRRGGAARERLPGMAEHTSKTERRAEQSERELLQWKKVRFLDERVGETLPGPDHRRPAVRALRAARRPVRRRPGADPPARGRLLRLRAGPSTGWWAPTTAGCSSSPTRSRSA